MKWIIRLITEEPQPRLKVISDEDQSADSSSVEGPENQEEQDQTEEYWSGRNFAMRRSARVAA